MIEKDFAANLEYYKTFYYTVKCGTLTAAANRLYLTQPTVTNAIQRLEDQLGCTLFFRSKRGMILTQEGELLWQRVEPACQLLLSAEQELESIQSFDGGSLSIAATEMSFLTYVLPVLELFTSEHPNVKIRFRNALTKPILNMLQSGEIDLAILHTPFQADDQILVKSFGSIEECFVTGPRYSFLAESPHSLEDLTRYPFISVLEGSATKLFARGLFQQHGLDYDPEIEVTTIELVVQAALHNFGIAMLPWERVHAYVEQGNLFRIPVTLSAMEITRKVCVLVHRDIPLRPAAKVFLNNYLQVTDI